MVVEICSLFESRVYVGHVIANLARASFFARARYMSEILFKFNTSVAFLCNQHKFVENV